ncbi:hypothetical protein FB451DRAFT_1531676 [Mycena latifolia]|nr:hypothetical protein FB451DRAFT_1531676 [Mycena latifolia]
MPYPNRRSILLALLATRFTFASSLPRLSRPAWHKLDACSTERKLAESRGDCVINYLLGKFIQKRHPALHPEEQEAVLKVVSQNATFQHILVCAGHYHSSEFRKAAGNALETIFGAFASYAKRGRMDACLERIFAPVVDRAAEVCEAMREDSEPAPERQKRIREDDHCDEQRRLKRSRHWDALAEDEIVLAY